MKGELTMKYVDVIGIGAINYDYMFPCKRIEKIDSYPDNGEENIGVSNEMVEDEISELYITGKRNYSTQIGGSALLALKAIKAIDKNISIGFVGVCGKINDFDKRYGKSLDPKSELSFIDSNEWLFYTNETTPVENRYIGKAAIKLNRSNTRGNINISLGANDLILDLINKQEVEKNESIVDYLAQARWIHISSLSRFEQFAKMMEYAITAKKQNRFLKISIDPGDKYTKTKRTELQKYIKEIDYVFLNNKEFHNLILNEDLPKNDKYIKLSTYFNNPYNVNTKIFIIKNKNKHILIDFVNRKPYVYYHNKLQFYKINNDTGAGDCFAGGFIAGLLSDKLISQQPAPISLGVLAAKARMTSVTNSSIYENIEQESKKFFIKKYKNGELNRKQRTKLFFQSHVDFVKGFITSLIISYICSLLIK